MSLVSFQYRNFRLLWWGLLVSFTGSFMQNAAILWHVSLLVPREHLPNALTLNSIAVHSALVAGPALGGVLIGTAGVGWVYVANAVSFGAVVVALLMMRGVESRPVEAGRFTVRAAFEGLRFVFRAPLIRSTMLLDFFATFFSSATALLPIFAQDILRVGPGGYGWLYAAPAVGALGASAAMVSAMER